MDRYGRAVADVECTDHSVRVKEHSIASLELTLDMIEPFDIFRG